MTDENAGAVDLLGDPWTPPRDPRGRKRHKRNAQVAENVALLKASGQTVEAIALRLGISEPTLRKYYFREIEQGADLAEAVLNEAMWKKALAGNVGAARFIRENMKQGEARAASTRVRDRAPPKDAPLGKKAERQAAAERVSGRLAVPTPPPTLVVNNR